MIDLNNKTATFSEWKEEKLQVIFQMKPADKVNFYCYFISSLESLCQQAVQAEKVKTVCQKHETTTKIKQVKVHR